MSNVLKIYGPVLGRILIAPLFLPLWFHRIMAMYSGPFSLRKESESASAR